jgi:dimethylsulfide dehydrogenase subunit beta/complex iron-sulfur molybdoenzyme family reductase subunit beta
LSYLESLFGPRVGEVLDTLAEARQAKADGKDSELMDTLIGFKHAEMFKLS